MATGSTWQPGGVVDPADVRDAGEFEWASVSGMQPHDPLMQGGPTSGGAALNPYDPDVGRSRIVTMPAGESTSGPMQTPDSFDDWRDLIDPHGPAFWVFLLALAAIGLVQLRVMARGGPARAAASLG